MSTNYSKYVQQIAKMAIIPKGARIYLAVPYTSDHHLDQAMRFEKVNHAASVLMHYCGWAVFSPISQSHPIGQYDAVDTGWETWEAFDIPWLSVSEYVVVYCLPGWHKSVGVTGEIEYAKANNIPVYYLNEDMVRRLESGSTWEELLDAEKGLDDERTGRQSAQYGSNN